MTSKAPTKKKASKPSAAAINSGTKAKSPASSASIIPFNPLQSMGQFTPSTPSFDGTTMETMMNNYKDQYEKMSSEAASSMRESVETVTKGAEIMMKTLTDMAQESAQRNAEAMKSLMACRTMNEFAEAQNKLAQQNFDECMSAMTKMSEMSIKMWTEAFEPINSQMTKAMSSTMSGAMKKSAA